MLQRRPRERAPRVPLDVTSRDGRFSSASVLFRWFSGRSSCWTDRHPTSPSHCPLRREKKTKRHHAVLRHEAVVHGFHMILHFVRPGEFFSTYRTREYLPLMAFVVKKSVSLEAVFILERFLNVELRTLSALIDTLGYRGVTKEIQTANGHLGQLFSRILRVRCGATPHASLRHLSTRRCRHGSDLVTATRRRGIGGRCRATTTATSTAVLRVVPTGCR